MSNESDTALVAQVVMFHSQKAFSALVGKYQSPVRRFLLNLTLGDSMLSDDLAQETFIKAYTHISGFKSLSNFSTWLFRIAYNVFYDYLRSRKETSDIEVAEGILAASEHDKSDIKIDLYRGLSLLKNEERTCLVLCYMEDVPIKKAAIITGMREGTVKSHLSRGKEKLTTYLKNNGYER